MSIKKACLSILLFGLFCMQTAHAQPHPLNQLGRAVFDSFRDRDLSKFINNSVFALKEDEFRNLLREIKNDALITHLREGSKEDWSIAFAKNWRKHWRHIAKHQKSQIGSQAFDPILVAAKADGIQWQTTVLTAIEVLLPVKLEQSHFEVKRDTYTPKVIPIDANGTNEIELDSDTLYFDRGITYRLKMDSSTHRYGFMIGRQPENSKKRFDRGIQRNGASVGDILVEFEKKKWPNGILKGTSLNKENATKIYEELVGQEPNSAVLDKLADSRYTVDEFTLEIHEKYYPSNLYYFCPDRKGVGGSIRVTDAVDLDKPNQRIDLLLTFDFGQPKRSYQILLQEILSTPRGPLFFEKPQWLGEVEAQVGTY